jgi:hypothetical protein
MVVENALVVRILKVLITVLVRFLFHTFLNSRLGDTADETLVLLVVLNRFAVVTQLRKCIDHNTTYDVAKQ